MTIEEQNKKLIALIEAMQQDAEKYLNIENTHHFDQDWFIHHILLHLDGPEQREAMER